MLSDRTGANHSDVISPSSHHRRVSSQEWWRDHIGARNTHTGHQPSVDVSRAEKHPGNVTSSQSTKWLESKQFSSTLICSDQNFCPGRRHGTRNSKALGGNVFSEFYNLPAFADLRCCPELDTQVFHCPHDTHRPIDCPDIDIKTNPFVKIFTLIMSCSNKNPNPSRCVCPGGFSPPSFVCHYHS